jgi:hypothetical protein
MFSLKPFLLTATLIAGAALPTAIHAQQVVIEAPQVQVEPVRWRRAYYYPPTTYYQPYAPRPYVTNYRYYNDSYRPYWGGYYGYNYGPVYYSW